jgi:hypothetical protein
VGDEIHYSNTPLVTPGEIALSDSEKDEALADSLEAQFQPVVDPSDPAVIETVDVALRAFTYEPASELMLTDPAEVQHAIRGLKISLEKTTEKKAQKKQPTENIVKQPRNNLRKTYKTALK